ncbi:MAG: hypothetical protein J5482_02630 [Oscillospiraceae bacterium]|nr:hypothetical protein [Oscillospiraceae bacterium]
MHPQFAILNTRFFLRSHVYTGSIGAFRYRFAHSDSQTLHAAVYTDLCYEKAHDVTERDFPWTDTGVEALKAWLQERYESFISERT